MMHRADARASSPGRMKYPVAGLVPRVGPKWHAQPRGEARGKVEATKEHDLGGRGTMGKRAEVPKDAPAVPATRLDIRVVLNEVLPLTKFNYNCCRFSDGMPVTLKFADAVGEILTSGPVGGEVPLPFKHYI